MSRSDEPVDAVREVSEERGVSDGSWYGSDGEARRSDNEVVPCVVDKSVATSGACSREHHGNGCVGRAVVGRGKPFRQV